MDAHTWTKREERFAKKFSAGRSHIPALFKGIAIPSEIEQIALLGFASNANVKFLSGGRIVTTAELFAEIVAGISGKRVAKAAIPEQYPLLRTIQFACEHRHAAGWQ